MVKTLYWTFIGAVLILPLIFSDKLIALNPWGFALVRLKDPHGTDASFYTQHFGTLASLAIAGFVFFLYAFHTDIGPMKSLMMAAFVFSFVHWLSFYACGAVFLAVGWAMLRTGAIIGGGAAGFADAINEQIEIGRFERSLEVPEFDRDGMIISYRYLYDLDDGAPPLSITSTGQSRGGVWKGGFLQSDRIPTLKNASGIYSCKNPNDPELEIYAGAGRRKAKIKNWGKVVEHRRGYRAQYSQIIEWLT